MSQDGIERLTGDLKTEAGAVVAAGIEVELDRLGEIHVAVFQGARTEIGENVPLVLELPGGRKIQLFVLASGFQLDGTVRAAVVGDTVAPTYSLGLSLNSGETSDDDEDE